MNEFILSLTHGQIKYLLTFTVTILFLFMGQFLVVRNKKNFYSLVLVAVLFFTLHIYSYNVISNYFSSRNLSNYEYSPIENILIKRNILGFKESIVYLKCERDSIRACIDKATNNFNNSGIWFSSENGIPESYQMINQIEKQKEK